MRELLLYEDREGKEDREKEADRQYYATFCQAHSRTNPAPDQLDRLQRARHEPGKASFLILIFLIHNTASAQRVCAMMSGASDALFGPQTHLPQHRQGAHRKPGRRFLARRWSPSKSARRPLHIPPGRIRKNMTGGIHDRTTSSQRCARWRFQSVGPRSRPRVRLEGRSERDTINRLALTWADARENIIQASTSKDTYKYTLVNTAAQNGISKNVLLTVGSKV
ncbi:uncharacterized protein N7459_006574 [Penicillium hispanicum]|uniref:uncharacterized protein n=1 Tax=Penicillium hispanicum TaxID=1080232 RepID=UPI0025423053|nr:uncharacterized protein N7459_006574 [Penicillium hispanicum]KAJ5577610.1 hypothetical protein N7459_006574 [Penicillium hispanicum]